MNCISLHVHPRQPHAAPLVTRSPALRDDLGHLIHLSLRTAERPQSLLRELSRTLVLAVAEKFDDAAFVRRETAVKCQPIHPNPYLARSLRCGV